MKFHLFPSLSTHVSSICDNRLSSSGDNSFNFKFHHNSPMYKIHLEEKEKRKLLSKKLKC